MRRNPHKERGPCGRPRWKRKARVTPWKPRVQARRTCGACGVALMRKTWMEVGPVVVEGRYLASGRICTGHLDVYRLDPCPCGGADLFRLDGPRHVRGRLVLDGIEYVTWRGEVVRECPVCERPLPGIDPAAKRVREAPGESERVRG